MVPINGFDEEIEMCLKKSRNKSEKVAQETFLADS